MSSPKNKRKKVYIFLFIALAVVAAAVFIPQMVVTNTGSAEANSDDPDTPDKEKETVVPVELTTASPGRISAFLTATANLRALREVDVVSQTEGLVYDVFVEEGDRVREGQLLCQLDDRPLQIRLQSAQQKLAQARLQREKARIRREKAQTQIKNGREDLGRYQQLYEEKLVSERDVAQLQYRIDELLHDEQVSSNETRELEHRVEELEAEIAQVQLEISQTGIRAPFAGMITERAVEKGQTVRNLDRLFRLGNFSRLYADVYLSERDANQVRPGQEARLTLGAAETRRRVGKVVRVSPVVDQSTGTVKVTVELNKAQDDFRPGAFVRVGIETDSREGNILVPKRAILEEDGKSYVFVAEDEEARRVEVHVGYQNDGKAEILKGLETGQKIVVAGQGALKEKSKIKVVDG